MKNYDALKYDLERSCKKIEGAHLTIRGICDFGLNNMAIGRSPLITKEMWIMFAGARYSSDWVDNPLRQPGGSGGDPKPPVPATRASRSDPSRLAL